MTTTRTLSKNGNEICTKRPIEKGTFLNLSKPLVYMLYADTTKVWADFVSPMDFQHMNAQQTHEIFAMIASGSTEEVSSEVPVSGLTTKTF